MMDILHRVGIKSSSNAVFAALTTREGLSGWWTNDTKGDSRVGATLTFGFSADGVEIGALEMKVLELHPRERVLWQVVNGPAEWTGTRIGWDLKQDGEYCIVVFKHEGWRERAEFMHHCSTKWAIFMMSLKSLVESGQGAPNPVDTRIGNWN
jgi:uncharacterized protein YndB with AHSA1/START domain